MARILRNSRSVVLIYGIDHLLTKDGASKHYVYTIRIVTIDQYTITWLHCTFCTNGAKASEIPWLQAERGTRQANRSGQQQADYS